MKRSLVLLTFSIGIALTGTDTKNTCPVTKPPNPLFVPPAGYANNNWQGGDFLYGSSALWTIIHPHTWRANGNDGYKLAYWRLGFVWTKESRPELTVVARRLDGTDPLVWAPRASGIKANGVETPDGMAMMTGIDIPAPGCWEIAAHYIYPNRSKAQDLRYTIWAER
jgi:hypothetical protein